MVATAKVSEADSLLWCRSEVVQVPQCQGRDGLPRYRDCTADRNVFWERCSDLPCPQGCLGSVKVLSGKNTRALLLLSPCQPLEK